MPRLIVFALALLAVAGCGSPQEVSGYYTGIVDFGGIKLRLIVDLRSDHKLYSRAERLTSEDQARLLFQDFTTTFSRNLFVDYIVNEAYVQEGNWKFDGNGDIVAFAKGKTTRAFTARLEPNGDIILGRARLSRGGQEPLTAIRGEELPTYGDERLSAASH